MVQTRASRRKYIIYEPQISHLHPDDDSSAGYYNERLVLNFMGLKYECLKLGIMNNQQLFVRGIESLKHLTL